MTVSDKINLDRLSYVIYEHPDRVKFLEFSEDFGFERAGESTNGDVFLRGYGADPYIYVARQAAHDQGKRFIGSGFRARTEADFERASKLSGAHVSDLTKRPGGGKMVSLTDVNGYEMQIVFGQEERIVPEHGLSNVSGGDPNVNGAVKKARKGRRLFTETDMSMISAGLPSLQVYSIEWRAAQPRSTSSVILAIWQTTIPKQQPGTAVCSTLRQRT
jgi:hypothetical protein